MKPDFITLERLTKANIAQAQEIQRDDISDAFVDNMDTIMELTQYGIDHKCKGHTYAIKQKNVYIGLILLGEAFTWDTDPEEMKGVPFYRLMGLVIDKRYRNCGIGGYALEKAIELIYDEFGVRPIALGVHKDNFGAERFYLSHGFRKTDVMEGNDYYYLRYPIGVDSKCREQRFSAPKNGKEEGSEMTEEYSAMAVVLWGNKILTTTEEIYGKEALSLPKGHREDGETLMETAIRECFEETNIAITKEDCAGELEGFSYEFLTPSNQRIRKTIAAFLFRVENAGVPLAREARMAAVTWMDKEAFLEKCSYENVKKVVMRIQ